MEYFFASASSSSGSATDPMPPLAFSTPPPSLPSSPPSSPPFASSSSSQPSFFDAPVLTNSQQQQQQYDEEDSSRVVLRRPLSLAPFASPSSVSFAPPPPLPTTSCPSLHCSSSSVSIASSRASFHLDVVSSLPSSRFQRWTRAFTQQRLSAWQPVLSPRWVIASFMVFGLLFLAISIGLMVSSNSVVECSVRYDDFQLDVENPRTIELVITPNHCVGLSLESPIISGTHLYLYYALTNFYQNHRRYVNSLSPAQLRGEVFTTPSQLSQCHPIVLAADQKRVRSPCGLQAWSVFNDTISLFTGDGNRKLNTDESPETICWQTDYRYLYKNPTHITKEQKNKIDFWIDESIFPGQVENGHFINWMRTAALPNFRKLYSRILESEVKLPVLVRIINRFPVQLNSGTKSIVLSTASWYGGRNPFLGIFYMVIGSVCVVLAAMFTFRNRKSPRILGDVRHLHWTSMKSGRP